MTQEQLRIYADGRGMKCLGPTLMGAWNGYPFHATLKPGRVNVLTASFTLLKTPSAGELRRGRKELAKGCALTWQSGKVNLVCSARDEALFDLFQDGMNTLTRLFRETGAGIPVNCGLCRKEGCDSLSLVGGNYVPTHRACCESSSYDAVAQAEVNAMSGSYLTGWLGALLGGVVGAVPTILVALLLEIISVWLCLLIPLGAYYGYKLCKGKMNRMATVATIVSALLQVFVVEQVIFYAAIVTYMGIWPSVFASIAYYFEIMTVGDMLANMLQTLLFVALGVFCVFGIIRRTNQHVTLDAGVMVDSLTDLNGHPFPAPAAPVQEPAYVTAAADAITDPIYRQAPFVSDPGESEEDPSDWYENEE